MYMNICIYTSSTQCELYKRTEFVERFRMKTCFKPNLCIKPSNLSAIRSVLIYTNQASKIEKKTETIEIIMKENETTTKKYITNCWWVRTLYCFYPIPYIRRHTEIDQEYSIRLNFIVKWWRRAFIRTKSEFIKAIPYRGTIRSFLCRIFCFAAFGTKYLSMCTAHWAVNTHNLVHGIFFVFRTISIEFLANQTIVDI